MRFSRTAAALAATVLWLAGCAAPEIPFDRGSANDVRTIGIVTPSFPDDAQVVLASSVGQTFGLIGALVDAGMQANRDSQFNDALRQRHYSARDNFVENVAATLRAQGFTVALVPATRGKSDFLARYPTDAEPKVDAYLDLVAAGVRSSTPYRPTLAVRARLVSARDSSVLMQDVVVYNPVGPAAPSKAVTIAPDPAFQFVDFDALVADPDRAVLGLRTAVEQSAHGIGTLLQ